MKTAFVLAILFFTVSSMSASDAGDRFMEAISLANVRKFQDGGQALRTGPTIPFPDGQIVYRYELEQAVKAFQEQGISLSKKDLENLLKSEKPHVRYAICLFLQSKYEIDPVKLGYRPLQDPNSESNLKAIEATLSKTEAKIK